MLHRPIFEAQLPSRKPGIAGASEESEEGAVLGALGAG